MQINYKFNNEALLAQALYTAQYGNTYNQGRHCKEFTTIGDIILKLILALKAYDDGIRTPGGITLSKQIIDSNEMFGSIAKEEFNLSKYIFSIEGEDLTRRESCKYSLDYKRLYANHFYFSSLSYLYH